VLKADIKNCCNSVKQDRYCCSTLALHLTWELSSAGAYSLGDSC
jgi:hypothetical protein